MTLRDAERRLALVLADGAKVQVIDQIWILGEALVEQGPVRLVNGCDLILLQKQDTKVEIYDIQQIQKQDPNILNPND